MTITELVLFEPAQLTSYGISIGLTATFATILFYTGGFGGADAKALMCLALALPFYPTHVLAPMLGPASPISRILFPLTVFSNSVLLVAALVMWIISVNIYGRWKTGRKFFEGTQSTESRGKKMLVLVTGYKVPISKLKEKWHVYPLEDIEETTQSNPHRKLLIIPRDEGREAVVKRLANAVERGTIEDGIWASPGLPMLILITLGLIVALFLGDIIWTLVSLMFR